VLLLVGAKEVIEMGDLFLKINLRFVILSSSGSCWFWLEGPRSINQPPSVDG